MRIEVPGARQPDIVIGIVIPVVVEVETVIVEVAEDEAVTVRVNALFVYSHPSHWKLRFTAHGAYILSSLYFISEQIVLAITSIKNKQEVLSPSFSHAIAILEQRYSGEDSKDETPAR